MDEVELKGMATDFFKNLYHQDQPPMEFPVKGCFLTLSSEDLTRIQAPFSYDEIK